MRSIIYRDAYNIQRETSIFELSEFVSVFMPGLTYRPVLTNAQGMIDSTLVGSIPSSLMQITKIADEPIMAGDCVYSISNNRVRQASFDADYKTALVRGIALNAASTNDAVTFAVLGIVTLPLFSIFQVNEMIYLDQAGGLTNERPINGYLVPVGTGLGDNAIMVQIGYPTRLNGGV